MAQVKFNSALFYAPSTAKPMSGFYVGHAYTIINADYAHAATWRAKIKSKNFMPF